MHREFEPQLVSVLREGYSRKTFFADLTAGTITGIVALPLAIAFGIASGATPQQGLFTAIIAGALISILSGSRVQIGGPTGAFIVIVYSIISQHGMDGLILATIMAGVMLVFMGAGRLGGVIKFIPYPVTLGFTSGIAAIIALTQLRDFFGLPIENLPAEFLPKIEVYAQNAGAINYQALLIGALTIFVIRYWSRLFPRLPGSLIAVLSCTALVFLFGLNVETIGSRFGEIKTGFPALQFPEITIDRIVQLFPAALAIAMLGAIESLLSAVVADGMTGGRHRSNIELVAQGVANIVTPLFGGIPSTGAIARTATNVKNGGRTPFAGIIHALVLLLIVIFLGRFAALIPMAVLAGVLLMVSLGMSEYHLFIKMFRAPKSDVCVMLCTFLLTVFLDLTVAIPAGMILASFLFMHRMEQVTGMGVIGNESADSADERADPFAISRFDVPEEVAVFEIQGPFFFGAARKFQDSINDHGSRILILRMRNVPAIDATGLFALEDTIKQMEREGGVVIISGINPQPLSAFEKAGLAERIGRHRIHPNIAEALRQAECELVRLREGNLTEQIIG